MKTTPFRKRCHSVEKPAAKLALAIGAFSLLGMVGASAAPLIFYYTPTNTSTDVWSSGTNWNLTPESSLPTQLVIGPSGNYTGAVTNVTTNDITTANNGFLVSVLTLRGTGASGVNDNITINSASGKFINLDSTIPLGNPQVNLDANSGSNGGTLTYTIASPVTIGSTMGGGLPLVITGNGTARFNFSGIISGTLGLSKSGSNTVAFSGSNTYSGATSVLGGTLIVGANALSGADGALGNAVSSVLVGDVSGNKSAALLSGGAFTIGRNITIQAGSSGTATLGGNTDDNSFFTGNIALSKDVNLQSVTTGARAVTFNTGVISGAGFGVVKSGSGTVILGGVNTYTGATTVNQGTLKAGVATQAFGLNSAVTLANVAGATLDITGYNETIGSLAGGGATGGNVTLGSATLTVGSNSLNTSYSGAISGAGNLVKTGTGSLTLAGANSYTGVTSVLSGTLQIGANVTAGANGPIGNATSALLLGDTSGSSSASLVASGAFAFGRDITIQAGSSGTATLGGSTDNNSSFTGNILLNKNVTLQSVTTGAKAVTFSTGVISGAGYGITKSGSGTVILSGSNTYTGATNVTMGTLKAGVANTAFGSNSAVVLTNTNGVILDITGYNTTIGSLAGGGAAGGNVTLGSAMLTIGGNNTTTTFSGILSGAGGGVTKVGTGTLTLSGSSTYTGATNVNGGTLKAGAAISAFGVTSAVTLANTAGVTLDLGNNNETIGSLAGGGAMGGTVVLGSKTLTTGGDNTSTNFAGVISGAGGGLTKVGTGTMTLSSSNTYTGTTTVNLGTLKAGVVTSAFGVNSAVTFAVAVDGLDITGFDTTIGSLAGGGVNTLVTLGSNTLTIGSNNTTTTFSGVISGSGGITKVGTGTQTLSRANTYTGATNVNGGTLKAGVATSAFGVTSAVTLANSAGVTLDLGNNSETIGSLSGGGAAGGNVTLGTGILTTGGDNTSTNFAGIISGAGGLTKVGTGTMTLSNANTYTGATTVNAGMLQAGVSSNVFGSNSAVTLANTAGAILDLNGYNQTIGSLAGGGTTGGQVTLGSGTLTLGGLGTNTAFSGVVSGFGGLTKIGAGTTTLQGANTYTGTTVINQGTVKLGAGGSLSSASSLQFIISGIFNFNNTSASASQGINLLTFTAGDGTVLSTFGSGTNTLTFNSLAARQVGAVGNLTESGGTASTNKIVITTGQTAKTLVDKGIFFNGSNYASIDANGYVRAFDYTQDVNAVIATAGATLGAVSASSNVKMSGAISAQTGAVLNTLNISGNNNLTLANGATLTLNGILKSGGVAGGATISGGAGVQVGADQELVIRTDVANDALTISTPVLANGNNALTKSGAGTLALSATNTYNGVTTINAGTVQISGSNGLGDGSATNTITFNGGTLESTGNTYDLGTNRSVTLNTAATVQTDSGSMTISGTVRNGGYGYGAGSLTKTGAGTLVLAGSNTYTGTTTVNGGILKAGAGSQAFGSNSAVTLANTLGVTLDTTGYDNTIGSLAGGGTTGGNVVLGSNTLTVGSNGTPTTFSGVISGAGGGLTKIGAGTQTLSGSNTYTGATTVNSGSLKAGVATQAFGINSAVTLSSGGTLDITGFSSTIGSLAGTGGTVTLGAATLTTGGDNSSTSYAGIIAGTGNLTKVGSGVMILTGSSTYTGTTTITAGELQAGFATAAFGNGANMVLDNTASVLLDLNNYSNTIGALSGGTNSLVTLGSATITLGNTSSTTFSGSITGTGGLKKQGTGTQTLSGSNSYTGTTNITAGTLAVTGGNAIADTSAVSFATTGQPRLQLNDNETIGSLAGGTAASGTVSLGSNTLTTGSNNTSTSYAGAIVGSGGLTKIGTGVQTLSGSNTYSGVTNINTGTLTVSGGNAIGDNSAVILSNALATNLQVNSSETIGSLAGGGTTGGNVVVSSSMTLITGNDGTSTSYSGVISGAGAFAKTGAGTQTISGVNTYTGATTVQGGTLALSTAATSNIATSGTLMVGDSSAHSTGTLDVTGVTNAGGFHVLSGQTGAGFGVYNAGTGKITVDSGAHWAPGASGLSVGANTVTGDLTLSGISDFTLGTPGTSHSSPGNSDRTNVSGALVLGGTLNLADNAGNGADGTFGGGSYKIFTQTGLASGTFAAINNIGTTHSRVDTSTSGAVYLDVYRQAVALVSTVNLPSVHVGGVLGSKEVTIINNNPNDGYTEGLNASLGTTTGALTFTGTPVVNLTGTDNSSYTVSLAGASTTNAGHKSGTVQVTLASNGTNSGYGNTALSTQTLTVAGDVFRLASPNNITSTVNVGYIHQGSTFNDFALTITNGSVNDGFSEGLDVATGTPTEDAKTYGGPLTNMFGTSTAITVGVDTSTAGVKNGTVPVNFVSNGIYSVLDNTALPTQIVTLVGQVYSGKSTWNTNGGGTWSDISKWETLGGAPGLDSHYQSDDTATFGSALTSGTATVSLSGSTPSITSLTFDNSTGGSYNIAQGSGTSTLVLNGGSSPATVTVKNGTHTISAPVDLTTDAIISLNNQKDELIVSGMISNLRGSRNVTKTGLGTLTMSGNASYSGTTTISGGTLSVTGTLAGTAFVSVEANASLAVDGLINTASTTAVSGTLSGNGTLGSVNIQNGGVLSPGKNAPGALSTGALAFSGSNATLKMEIGGTLGGLNLDQLRTSGPLSLNNALLQLVLMPGYKPQLENKWLLVDNTDVTQKDIGIFFGLSDGSHVTLTNDVGGGDFVIHYADENGDGGTDVYLTLTVAELIPEPATWTMLLGGLGILLFRRRAGSRNA